VLDFGYFALFDSQGFGQAGLGHAAGFAQFLERHRSHGFPDAGGDPAPPMGRHLIEQFPEGFDEH
jgi:hypothetical protein